MSIIWPWNILNSTNSNFVHCSLIICITIRNVCLSGYTGLMNGKRVRFLSGRNIRCVRQVVKPISLEKRPYSWNETAMAFPDNKDDSHKCKVPSPNSLRPTLVFANAGSWPPKKTQQKNTQKIRQTNKNKESEGKEKKSDSNRRWGGGLSPNRARPKWEEHSRTVKAAEVINKPLDCRLLTGRWRS